MAEVQAGMKSAGFPRPAPQSPPGGQRPAHAPGDRRLRLRPLIVLRASAEDLRLLLRRCQPRPDVVSLVARACPRPACRRPSPRSAGCGSPLPWPARWNGGTPRPTALGGHAERQVTRCVAQQLIGRPHHLRLGAGSGGARRRPCRRRSSGVGTDGVERPRALLLEHAGADETPPGPGRARVASAGRAFRPEHGPTTRERRTQ